MRAHDVLGGPGARGVERAHGHLVHAQRVGTVGVADLVGGDGVLERLAHLPVFLEHLDLGGVRAGGGVGPVVLPVALGHLGRGHVDAAGVGVGEGLDVPLVEQAPVGLLAGDVAEVEQDLVPEPRVQQVQHGVLDAAHVEVHAARVAGAVDLGARAGPVALVLDRAELLGVGGVDVAQLVPTGAGPVGHDVGVAGVGLEPVTEVQLDGHPLGRLGQWRGRHRVGVVGVERDGLVVLDLGQLDGQHLLGQRVGHAVGVVDHGERLAPVALPGEQPVAELVLDGALAGALPLEPGDGGGLGLVHAQAVEGQPLVVGGVHGHAVAGVGLGLHVELAPVGGRHDLPDGQPERQGKLVVARVVAGHGHDGAGAVAHEDVVGDEHRDLLAVDRVDGVGAGEDAGLVLVLLALELGLHGRGAPVGEHGLGGRGVSAGPALVEGAVGRLAGGRAGCAGRDLGPERAGELVDQRVLGRQDHVGGAEEGVGAGGEHLDGRLGHGEPDAGALRAADPVALHGLDLVGPVEPVEVVDEPVGVGGDPHHPLAEVLAEDGEVAALGAALGGDLLVGQDCAQAGAPVDRGVREVDEPVRVEDLLLLGAGQLAPGAAGEVGGEIGGQSGGQRAGAGGELLDELGDGPGAAGAGGVVAAVGRPGGGVGVVPGAVDLQEDPLGPAVEVGVGGGEDAAAVVAQAEAAELALHVGDVGLGGHARVLSGLDGVLLGGQAERVVAEGVQHVGAEHPVVAGEHVGRDVTQRVADVQPGAGRVGEHVLDEELVRGQLAVGRGQRTNGVGGLERAALGPFALPAGLDLAGERRAVAVGGPSLGLGPAPGRRRGLGLRAGGALVAAAHVVCSPWSRRCPHAGRVQPKPWPGRGRVSVGPARPDAWRRPAACRVAWIRWWPPRIGSGAAPDQVRRGPRAHGRGPRRRCSGRGRPARRRRRRVRPRR